MKRGSLVFHGVAGAVVLLVLLVLTGGGLAVAKKAAPARREASAKSTPRPPKEALLAAADEIIRQVAALRGLPPKTAVARGVLTREQIGERLKERIHKEYTPEEVRSEGRVLKRLGLLQPDADYEKLILELLLEQVAGFYDPFTAKLYIADWLPLEMQRPALAHEIEHALQDQYFDLKRFADPIKDDGDKQLAHSSLVEGDGTAVMLEFQAPSAGMSSDQLAEVAALYGKQMLQGGLGQTPKFDAAPAFLKQTLMFPYFEGLAFIEAIRRTQPWTRIDAAFADPPESSEQIIHPEKYLTREHPLKVTAAPLTSLGARKEMRKDVLGELEWRILFASRLADEPAAKAAAGWGGDRLVAYFDPAAPDAPPTVITLAAWDTETDAKEAETAARQLLAKLSGKTQIDPGKTVVYVDANGDAWSVERRGQQTLIVFGAPAASRDAVAAEVWKTWKVSK